MNTTQEPTQILARLDQTTYTALAKQLPPPHVSAETTAHQAGFLLGVQFVLEKLRAGFTIGGY